MLSVFFFSEWQEQLVILLWKKAKEVLGAIIVYKLRSPWQKTSWQKVHGSGRKQLGWPKASYYFGLFRSYHLVIAVLYSHAKQNMAVIKLIYVQRLKKWSTNSDCRATLSCFLFPLALTLQEVTHDTLQKGPCCGPVIQRMWLWARGASFKQSWKTTES